MKNVFIGLMAILSEIVIAVFFASLLYWISTGAYLLGIISIDVIATMFPWGYVVIGLMAGGAADIKIISKLKEDLS